MKKFLIANAYTIMLMLVVRSGVILHRYQAGLPNPAPLPLPQHLLVHGGIYVFILAVVLAVLHWGDKDG